MMLPAIHTTARPEPVEGLSLFNCQKTGQGFDKLSPSEFGLEAAE